MQKSQYLAWVAGVLLPASVAFGQNATVPATTPGAAGVQAQTPIGGAVLQATTPNVGAAVQATTPAAGGAVGAGAATQNPDQWRYVWHNNQWWYYTPQNSWLNWNGTAWTPFEGAAVSAGAGTQSYRSGAYDNRYYGNQYRNYGNYGPGVSGGYLSPNGPSSRANQYRIPFYMRADRRVLGMYP